MSVTLTPGPSNDGPARVTKKIAIAATTAAAATVPPMSHLRLDDDGGSTGAGGDASDGGRLCRGRRRGRPREAAPEPRRQRSPVAGSGGTGGTGPGGASGLPRAASIFAVRSLISFSTPALFVACGSSRR